MSFLPNSFQKPNAYVDRFIHLLNGDEWKVLDYACRRIFGFRKKDNRDRIAVSQFVQGLMSEDGERRLDHGVGLSKGTVVKCLRELTRFGFLIEVEAGTAHNDGTLYEIQDDDALIDLEGLEERQLTKATAQLGRASAAREAKAAKAVERSVGQTATDEASGLSDNPQAVCPTDGERSVGQTDNNKRENKSEKKALSLYEKHAGSNAAEVEELVDYYRLTVEDSEPSSHEVKRVALRVREKGLDYCKQVVEGVAADTWEERYKYNSLSHIFETTERMTQFVKIASRAKTPTQAPARKVPAGQRPSRVDQYREKKGEA